ncbi:MAG: VanW family protein [Egibacteraceae bacterium]
MEIPIEAPPSPARRPLAGLASAVLLIGLALVVLRLARPGALPGVVLSDVELGGLSGQELHAAVAVIAERRAAAELTAVQGGKRVTATAPEFGYEMDVGGTVEAVLSRGRQRNPLAALADHLHAFTRTTTVQPVQRLDEPRVDEWAMATAAQLSSAPVEGAVRFEGASAVRVDPRPGARALPGPLGEAVRAALLRGGDSQIVARIEPVAPRMERADVDAVFALATKAMSAPITLSRGNAALTLIPAEIGALLRTEPGPRGEPPLRLVTDATAVERVITPKRRALFEVRPVNAQFRVAGGTVSISESSPGFRFDPAATAAQVLAVAIGDGPREVELGGEVLQPSLTTEQARELRITEQVAAFTTSHACCQSRVTNIHRIADMVDGALIRPGETFSLNGHVGSRTAAKGFVDGGAIQDGEFVEQVGGGVSQFTTTMFNAAYFGGYDIVEHKPHSYFISRYPEGREATLNYPTVDLKIRNNSPHGILVLTSYTDTTITVSLWGTRWVAVSSVTGPRTEPTTAETIHRENDELAPGTEQVVQEGGRPGFDVVVTRVLRFPDGRVAREPLRTRYMPEPRIIERNTP